MLKVDEEMFHADIADGAFSLKDGWLRRPSASSASRKLW
jgi:hypothetical protein